MKNNLLVDTSILIDFLRKKHKENTQLIALVDNKHQLSISIITHAELYAGKSIWEKKRARNELERLLSGLTVIPLDAHISELSGKIKAKYNIHIFDAVIAATAVTKQYPLVTKNLKHFKSIPNLKLYKGISSQAINR